MESSPSPSPSFGPFSSRDLQEWRAYVLDGILRGVMLIWIIALISGIGNVFESYKAEAENTSNSLLLAVSTIAVYLGTTALLAIITFVRKLPFYIRAGVMLFVFYILGSMGLLLSSLSGDGRIILFAFIIFSAIFLDLRYSLLAFFISLATMLVIGWLQVNGHVFVPPERQINSVDAGAWVSGTVVFLALSIAVFISITYLLRILGTNLESSHKLLKREQRLSQILRTITDINQLIVREQNSQKLLSEACEMLVLGRGYSFAWVGLLDSDNVTVKLVAQVGDDIQASRFKSRLDEEDGSLECAKIAIRSRSFFLVTPSDEYDPCKACPRRIRNPYRTGIALPLLRDERVLGALFVDHTKPNAVFDDEETQILQGLANDLAYALEKIEADQRLLTYARNQQLLNEITKTALEIQDRNNMLDIVARKLSAVLGADGYYITMWNSDENTPILAATSESLKETFDNGSLGPDSRLLSDAVLNAGKALVIEDITDTAYINSGIDRQLPISSALGLPLIANNQKLGAVIVCYSQPHIFLEDEVELGQQAANQIALAVAKFNLDMETHIKAVELASLYTATQDMASSLLDPPALLTKLARHMSDALQVTSSTIMAVNLVDSTMQVVAEYWSAAASAAEVHSDLGRVYPNAEYATILNSMLAGEVLVIHSDDDDITSIEKQQFGAYDVKSMMFVPIMAHGKLLGDIELWESRQRREFTPAEIRLAQAMAGHAASIIENSTLFTLTRQRESELGALLRIARAVSSSLQLSDVLMQAATTLTRLLRVDNCTLSDYLPERNGLVTIAMYSSDGDVSEPGDIGQFFSLDNFPATLQVLESGQPMVIRVDDPNADAAELEQVRSKKMFTSLLIPLRLRGQSLGLAELFSSDPQRDFRPEEVQFAGDLADQVSMAVENAHLYEKLEQRESYFRALIENSAEGITIVDAEGYIRYSAPAEERLTGYSLEEIQGQSAFQYIHPQDIPRVLETFADGISIPGAVRTTEYRLQRKDGEWRYFEITGHNMLDDPHINGIVANYRDVTERKMAEQAVRESQSRLEAIVSTALNGIITIDSNHHIVLFNPSAERVFGYSASEVLGQPLDKLIPNRYHHLHASHVEKYGVSGNTTRKKGLLDSLYGQRANGEEFPMEAFISYSEVGGQKFFTVIFQDITERKQAEDALKASERKFRALAENIPSVVYQSKNDSRYTFIYLNDSIEQLTGYPKADFLDGRLSFVDLYHPEDWKSIPFPNLLNETPINQEPFHITYRIRHRSGDWVWVDEWGTAVRDAQGEVQYLEGVMIDITERKRFEEDLRRHTHELETLTIASFALRTAQNVKEMVPILTRQALHVVGGDYGAVFLLEPESGDYVLHGWFSINDEPETFTSEIENVRHRPGEGITGHVAETGEIYLTEDIQLDPHVLILEGEQERLKNLHGGISMPIRAQEKVIGVLHIRSTERRIFKKTEVRLLTALVENAGNAIHRALLFEQTLQHAEELALAYDNTLAGWARALELRDELTEGHTRRVTELTIKLARALNIPENEIVHMRRGALLHDIGKMGIPDSILHKPGPFTGQERYIMRQHPQYARDMLASISFLQPAIDIPYCHHEHWDGAGYPRGLKGEEIPLAARVFTVVDVWDALTSDRPYRQAWPKEKTREYILERSGKQFDPHIVEAFFSLVMKD